MLERILSSLEGNRIHPKDLPFHLKPRRSPRGPLPGRSLREAQARNEKESIQGALAAAGYNKARAARMLGIHRTLLYKKMKRHGLALYPEGTPPPITGHG